MVNYKQLYSIKAKNKERILKICPDCTNESGIYFFLREEDGFKFAYIGQAKHILDRLVGHLSGYQHIDLSLRKRGFKTSENPCGYTISLLPYPEGELNEREQYFIRLYANSGYQLLNKTSGSQGKGKKGLDNQKHPNGYYDGVKQGEKKSRLYVKTMFEKYLYFSTKKNPPNKLQERKLKEFQDWLNFF